MEAGRDGIGAEEGDGSSTYGASMVSESWFRRSLIKLEYLRANEFLWPQKSSTLVAASMAVISRVRSGKNPLLLPCRRFQTAPRIMMLAALIRKILQNISVPSHEDVEDTHTSE